VERSHRIDAEEFYQLLDGVVIDDTKVFNDKLREWENFYNYHRPHGGLGGQTPYERLKQRTQTRGVNGHRQSHKFHRAPQADGRRGSKPLPRRFSRRGCRREGAVACGLSLPVVTARAAGDQRFPMPCGPARTGWTGTSARTILMCMTTPAPRCPTCGALLPHDAPSLLAPGERLTPWMIHDLPRIAWIVEYRAAELTDEERQIVRDATARMLRALEHDTV
jgi:hypothetical protein